MKNKTIKILTVISIVIMIIGTMCWFGTDALINESDSFTLLISLFGSIALRLLVVICTIGAIVLIWLIYAIIVLIKKIRQEDFKKRNLILLVILLFLVLVSSSILISLVSNRNIVNKEYDYSIQYKDNNNTYTIYKTKEKVEVYVEEQVICVKAPCPTIKRKENIKFSNKNMLIINNFIDDRFKNHNYNSIQIVREYLSAEENKILDSIIYNDEKLLNE